MSEITKYSLWTAELKLKSHDMINQYRICYEDEFVCDVSTHEYTLRGLLSSMDEALCIGFKKGYNRLRSDVLRVI